MKNKDRPEEVKASNRPEFGSDIAAELLRRLGVEYIALNPGASYRGFHDSLVNYLGNEKPQLLLCLNEDHAVSIAHGYAKATDKPMACVLHSNVGLLHGTMGIFNAWCDRAPMIVVGATGPVETEKRRPWIDWIHTAKDQGGLVRNFVKWDDEPRDGEGVIEAFLRGGQIANTVPRGPVYICLDAGLQEEEAKEELRLPDASRYLPPALPAAPDAVVKTVANLLDEAKAPLFLFGRGSRATEDWDRRVQLAERCGAIVFSSQRERSVFPTDHPAHPVAPFGRPGSNAQAIIRAADIIVSFDWIDLQGLMQLTEPDITAIKGKVVHVSLDRTVHNGWSMDYFALPPVDVPVLADADMMVAQLLDAVAESEVRDRKWDSLTIPKPEAPAYSENRDREIAPADIEIALAELRKDHTFTLAQTNLGWSAKAFPYRDPLDHLGHTGGGGLGAGPGLTIGVALALLDSGRPVVSVLGDGDFLQGATALWTAAHYEIPALFIVSNNRSNFNDEQHQEAVARMRGRPPQNRWIGLRIDDPMVNIAELAQAQGVEAEGPVKNVPQLQAALRRGFEAVLSGRPYLIDAHVALGYANKHVARGSNQMRRAG